MSEKEIESILRDFGEAFVKRDVEKTLSFFAEDAVLAGPEGTFRGKHEIKHYWTWDARFSPTITVRDSGIGIMVKENRAIVEHILQGAFEDKKYETPAMNLHEFSDGKIQHMRSYYDRLSAIKQVATQYTGIRGWFMKRLANYILAQSEKGLH